LPTKSPLKAAGPEVILKVALTLAPGRHRIRKRYRGRRGARNDGSPLRVGQGQAQLDAGRGRPGGIRERQRGVLR
jgi:hypothetical protein